MLEALLSPKAVAIVGASRTPGKVGHELVANLIKSQYTGAIVPINPSADQVLGLKCYPDFKSYPGKVDLVLIAVPTVAVKAAVAASIEAGVGAICIITAGFKEVGHAGAELEKELAAMCTARGVRLLGPNCLGLINTHINMNASFAKRMPVKGNISFLSQSGALCTAVLDWAAGRRMGMALLVSMGNKADLNETDFLLAFAEDPNTKAIVGYLESIMHGDEFMKAAEAAAAKKPIVVFKSGVTSAGVKAASSHTGSLAGADIAYGAAFRRSGIIRAETFEEMFDYATAFSMQPLPKGNRVAIVTNAGGPGIMAADAVEQSGLVISPVSKCAAELKPKLPPAASVANPIDVLGDAEPERYGLAVKAAAADPSVDSLIVILTPQAMTLPVETARAIFAAAGGCDKPVLACFMGGVNVVPGREELTNLGIPDYPAPERAVAAMKAMCDYAAWVKRPPRVVTRFRVNRRRVERIIHRHLMTNRFQIGEAAGKAILKAYDFNVLPGQVAATTDIAVETAERIGYPVAMKIVSPDIIHKSDVGGVKLGLSSAEAVRDAVDLMMLRIRQRVPQAQIEGVYIERMAGKGREVILGMTRDPQFGPMLMFGLGGIFVEVMKDVAFHIAPITEEEAMQMLEKTKSFALLKGVRGQASVDLAAIATGLQRMSQLVTDFPQIMEMDINPFFVGQVGTPSVVADARITLARPRA